MKHQNIKKSATAVLAMALLTMASTAVFAKGQTYDPYENYYAQYYGMTMSATQSKAQKRMVRRQLMQQTVGGNTKVQLKSNGPYADYYGLYYDLDTGITKVKATPESTVSKTDASSVSDPRNYYNW